MSPRITVSGFVGPSNTVQSRTLDAERTINLILQSAAPGDGRTPDSLMQRPGLRLWATFSGSPIRGIFHQDGRTFVVGGALFAEAFVGGTFGSTFAIANDSRPVSMCSNGSAGHQILIVSANLVYVYDLLANTLTNITTNILFPSRAGEFMDGYFLVYQGGDSRAFQVSALEDGTTWSALDVEERSIASDGINGFIRVGRALWILGNRTSEVWYDDGVTPFAPIQGIFIEHGCQATFSVQRADNTLIWLGIDSDGIGVVFRADGYTPRRISTTAVEKDLQLADIPTDAAAFVCQIQGHYYYVLIVPRDLTTSWVYDVSRDRWVEWAHWDDVACEWFPFRPWVHANCWNINLVGDRSTGGIYELTSGEFADKLVDV